MYVIFVGIVPLLRCSNMEPVTEGQIDSSSSSRLELPADVWNTIVDQLPVPTPKILPCVQIWKSSKKKWTTMVSKGCSDDEVKKIFGGWVELDSPTPYDWYKCFDCTYETVRHHMANLLAHGYEDESSRADPRGDIGPMRAFFFLVRRK